MSHQVISDRRRLPKPPVGKLSKVIALVSMSAGLALCLGIVAAGASGSSTPGVNPKLLGTYNASFTVSVNTCSGSGTYTGQLTLKADGTWTSSGLQSPLDVIGGSWLELGTTIALSDTNGIDPCFSSNPHGGTYTVKVTKNTTTGKYLFGAASSPGILNSPYNWSGTWYASQT